MSAITALKSLLLPPGGLLVLGLTGWLLGRRYPRLGRALVASAFVLLGLLSLPVCSGMLLDTLQSAPALKREQMTPDVEAIVVLGADLYTDAPEYGHDTVGGLTLSRLRYGAWLQRATGLPLLVSGGPLEPQGTTVAQAMAATLRDEFQIPVRWVEEVSRNTYENARESTAILHGEGIDTIYLVTSAFHMPRAQPAFERAGVRVVAAPTGIDEPAPLVPSDFLPRASAMLQSSIVLHEWIGRAWYRVAGRWAARR